MSRQDLVFPNHLAMIHELLVRTKALVESRNRKQLTSRSVSFSEGPVMFLVCQYHNRVPDKSKKSGFFDYTEVSLNLHYDDEPVYRGNGHRHDVVNTDLLRDAVDAMRRIMVLDDMGEIA